MRNPFSINMQAKRPSLSFGSSLSLPERIRSVGRGFAKRLRRANSAPAPAVREMTVLWNRDELQPALAPITSRLKRPGSEGAVHAQPLSDAFLQRCNQVSFQAVKTFNVPVFVEDIVHALAVDGIDVQADVKLQKHVTDKRLWLAAQDAARQHIAFKVLSPEPGSRVLKTHLRAASVGSVLEMFKHDIDAAFSNLVPELPPKSPLRAPQPPAKSPLRKSAAAAIALQPTASVRRIRTHLGQTLSVADTFRADVSRAFAELGYSLD